MRVAQIVYSTTVAVGRAERWPAADVDHAAVIALSTAFKESTMLADPRSRRPDKNVDMGLFGQRTLPGWYGTGSAFEQWIDGDPERLLAGHELFSSSQISTAFCACSRFSASAQISDCGPSMTSAVTSSPR